MTYEKGSRGECLVHHRIRCGECEYVAELEAEIDRWKRLHDEAREIGRNIEIERNEIEREYREYYEKADAEIERLQAIESKVTAFQRFLDDSLGLGYDVGTNTVSVSLFDILYGGDDE